MVNIIGIFSIIRIISTISIFSVEASILLVLALRFRVKRAPIVDMRSSRPCPAKVWTRQDSADATVAFYSAS